MTTNLAPAALLALLSLTACGTKPQVISVGAKNTTEQSILGEIIALHLEKQLPNARIDRKFNLGGTSTLQGAMQSADVDVYVEDVGTMVGGILKEDVPVQETVGFERAQDQYKKLYQVMVMNPLGFHHQFVVVSRADGKADTISAVAEAGKTVKLAVAYDLFDRKDTFTALATKYKLSMRELPLRMEPQAMYPALKAGTLDLAAGYSIDSWTNQGGFKILKDDQQLFPAHPACLLVRNVALGKVPDLQKALEALGGMIKDEAMQRMNQDVDLRRRMPELVAKEFLASVGL